MKNNSGRVFNRYNDEDKSWNVIRLKDTKIGDILRIFDNGIPMIYMESTEFIVTGAPYVNPYGIAAVEINSINEKCNIVSN